MSRWLNKLGRLSVLARVRLGIPVPIESPDRKLLETRIFPFYVQRDDIRRVLFVGTAWYTAHYERYFAGKEFWTLDAVPSRRRYGGRRHITDVVSNLHEHVDDGFFDLMIFNGVIGYGLDQRDDIERSIAACHRSIRPGGHFLLGWDDIDGHRPVRPEDIVALRAFERFEQSPCGSFRWPVGDAGGKHYDFYRRPLANSAVPSFP